MDPFKLPPLNYRDAGVNIDNGNRLVERIKPIAARTHRPEVLASIGGFNALLSLPTRYCHPILVAGTDGVGTKLKFAVELRQHRTIGIDLVAMCANDVVVAGAEPLFFLDYYATGRLEVNEATDIVTGIAHGCELAGMALVGGETAELPGLYAHYDYDLAGFCVGVVEKDNIIDGHKVQAGDALIGLASSGAHANGYSLIRRLLARQHITLDREFYGRPLGDVLLEPTRIYVKSILQLMEKVPVHALAHITGGGLVENIPRVLPAGLGAVINPKPWPHLFAWLQVLANIGDDEMYRTFNCGIGMVVCVPASALDLALQELHNLGETARPIGKVIAHTEGPRIILQD